MSKTQPVKLTLEDFLKSMEGREVNYDEPLELIWKSLSAVPSKRNLRGE